MPMSILSLIQRFAAIAVMLLLLASPAAAQTPQIVGMKDGVVSLTNDRTISISFPTAMVPASEIDVESKSSPIRLNGHQ
jgi:hypothetical protein